jgi:hypothetical protein
MKKRSAMIAAAASIANMMPAFTYVKSDIIIEGVDEDMKKDILSCDAKNRLKYV